jgi:hypothetical protein
MSAQSKFTVGDLGLLKTAGLVAGAAFIGWQIGKVIDDTDLGIDGGREIHLRPAADGRIHGRTICGCRPKRRRRSRTC